MRFELANNGSDEVVVAIKSLVQEQCQLRSRLRTHIILTMKQRSPHWYRKYLYT